MSDFRIMRDVRRAVPISIACLYRVRNALFIGLYLASWQPVQAQVLAALVEDYEALERQADPVTSAQDGDRESLSILPDVSQSAVRERRGALADLLSRMDDITRESLSADESLTLSLMQRQVRDQIAALGYDEERIPFSNDSGFHTLGDYLARTTQIRNQADAEAWLSRIAGLAGYYEQNIENARRGIATGFTQPRLVVVRVLEVAERQAATPVEEDVLLLPFAAETQARNRGRAINLIRERVKPALQQFVNFLEQEYMPAARPQLAIRSAPNGADYYRHLVKFHTTTSMTPDEIHALGQAEVQRIRKAMDRIIRELDFKGSFGDFQAFLRSDPRFYARSEQDLLEKAAEIAKRADDQLPGIFGKLPRLSYGVRPVPADIAPGYTTGRYWPGSIANGVAGGYMVNTFQLRQRPLYELPALTLHEAVPGHHLQIALSQELAELPYFRRNSFITAYVEGWGLYAESLGEDMGIYRTPYEQFGRYSYEMWRACRLVVDTGIHWLGWSLDKARQCFEDNTGLASLNITTELERYVSWPGQALAYKIGELTMQRLRSKAQNKLGDSFDLRTFHDALLGAGALPMDALEARIDAWIATQES